MPEKYRSISTNIIVSLALVTTLVLLVFGAVNYYRQRAELHEQLYEDLDFISSQLAGYLTMPVWQLDSRLQDDIVRDTMLNQRIYAIELWVASDYVSPHQIWRRGPRWMVIQGDALPEGPQLISRKRPILHEGEEIGSVSLVMSTRFMQQALERTLLTNVTAILVLNSILLAVLFLVIRRSVIKPLQFVERYADNVSLGKQTTESGHVTLSRELWTTLNALDAMVAGLRKAEYEYRSLFENALEGIYRFSQDGEILRLNTAMCRILGFKDSSELLNHSSNAWDYLVFDEQIQWSIKTLQEKGEVIDKEIAFYHKDGHIVWFLVNARLVTSEGDKAIVEGLATDITERKNAQEELARLNKNLEERIQERTADLEQANHELQKAMDRADLANKAKSEFLARMSHEIRTPMNAVIGLTNLALKTQLNDTQRNYLFKVRDSANHLLDIINDILDFSKIEAGKFTLAPAGFMLNQLFDELGDMFEARAAEKQIEFSLMIPNTVPLALVGDAMRLRQVLINLIGNAVKFTEQGSVSLKVSLDFEGNSPDSDGVKLRFSVKDTGIGISEEQQQQLFSPFTQVEGAMTRRFGGTGLGLSISKRLVSLMGGEVRVESVPGKGSTFSFTVLLGLQQEHEQRTLTPPVSLQNKRALIVDDNEAARLIYAEMVESFLLRQAVAESGSAAIETLLTAQEQGDPFDLVLLDWRMEGMNGIETAQKIRGMTDRLGKQPIILLTTMYGRDAFFQRMAKEEKSIDGLLHKPLNSSELFNAIMEKFGSWEAVVPRRKHTMDQNLSSEIVALSGARILLVEDNLINQEVATIILKGVGLEVDIASNGKVAVERLMALNPTDREWYDAVLMDVQMPEMDGYEATGTLRKDQRFSDLPIIAMTAHALKGDREACLDAGMNDFVSKPIEEEVLFQVLLRWIKPQARRTDLPPDPPAPDLAETPQARMARDKGLDITAGLERFKGNMQVYFNMLNHFLESNREAAREIQELIDAGEHTEAEKRVHSLKGISGNLGLGELYDASVSLDNTLKTGASEKLGELLDTFAQAMEKVLQAIASLEPQEPRKEMPPAMAIEPEALLTLMTRLEQELKKSSSKARHSSNELRRLLQGHLDYAQEVQQLEESIFRLDTDKALEALYALARKLNLSLPGKDSK